MISILIPVYNYSVEELVQKLLQQGHESGREFEIILHDDGSSNHLGQYDRWVNSEFVRVSRSERNSGRSKARNRLAEMASHRYLLFLDCDGIPVNSNFLNRYIELASTDEVLVGGREYADAINSDYALHRLYGIKRERNAQGFQSNNFLIARSDFDRVGGFDESLIQYGHEDTLFGVALKNLGISVKNIGNPVYHIGLETNRVFAEKSLKAVENAHELFMAGKISATDIRLLDFYLKWQKSPLKKSMLKAICKRKQKWMKICLSSKPRLFALDFLKLCRLQELNQAN